MIDLEKHSADSIGSSVATTKDGSGFRVPVDREQTFLIVVDLRETGMSLKECERVERRLSSPDRKLECDSTGQFFDFLVFAKTARGKND